MFTLLPPRLQRAGTPRFAVVLLLFALLWQAVTVQSHVHPGSDPALVKVSIAASGHEGGEQTPCYLCEAQALLGTALTPAPVAVVAPFVVATFYAPVALRPALCLPLWRRPCSRAPPASAIR